VVNGTDSRQFLTWDAGSGPSRSHWSQHLKIPWRHPNAGDWLDAKQNSQGEIPYAALDIPAEGTSYSFEIGSLVERWRRSGENRGMLLRSKGTRSPSVLWSGRISDNAPVLRVTQRDGLVVDCPCLAFAGYAESSSSGLDTRVATRVGTAQRAILQFDLSALKGEVAAAILTLHAERRAGQPRLEIYECDPPRFQLATTRSDVRKGLAASVGERALRSHPSVIRAGDFSSLERGVLFDRVQISDKSVNQQLPDPDFPGSTLYRGSFTPLDRGSFSGTIETMRANYGDPLRPPSVVEEELFCRLYLFLEDDWRSTRDANKMAVGWDLRMGWWNDAQGGYWQATTGNGGARGTGLKLFAPRGSNGGSQSADRWEYQGHSIRLEAGMGIADGNPYESLRPVTSYVYNLDQPTGYGQDLRHGTAVLQRGRWHCVEQQVRMNSITGPFDNQGNGQAVADGLLRTWVDGVLVSEFTSLRWRRHPQMGINGPWINWFYGGKQASEMTMHYRMNHLVLAREYIGPRTHL